MEQINSYYKKKTVDIRERLLDGFGMCLLAAGRRDVKSSLNPLISRIYG